MFKKLASLIRSAKPGIWDDFWWQAHQKPTFSGKDVSETSAMNYSIVYACVRAISEDLSSLPLVVFSTDGEKKNRAIDNPIYKLLHKTPNPEMTSSAFRSAMQTSVLLWGNAYAEILRSMGGTPISLWPLDSSRMTVRRIAGEVFYEYHVESGPVKLFPASSILHIPGISFNGLVGQSVIGFARESIALGLSMEEFGSRYFSNSATPRAVLEHPETIGTDAKARFLKDFNATYSGTQNSNKVMLLEQGMVYKQMSFNPQDSQFLDSRYLQIEEICRFFRVPPHVVQDLRRSTFSNIEHQSIEYVQRCLIPWAIRWEQAIDQKLLNSSPALYSKHIFDGILRGDLQTRYQAYAVGLLNGFLSINDVRRFEDMNPVNGGDEYRVQMQMIPINSPRPIPAPVDNGKNGEDKSDGKNGEDKDSRSMRGYQ